MTEPSRRWGSRVLLGSAAVVALIAAWEGGRLSDGSSRVYADRLAGGLPTVCNGLTRHVTATPIVVGERWSREQCDREQAAALAKIQRRLEQCFGPIPPPQNVFDAATSWAWNVGVTGVCGSQAMKQWQGGSWRTGCERMIRSQSGKYVWVFAGGRFVQGLANRRQAESDYCKQGIDR